MSLRPIAAGCLAVLVLLWFRTPAAAQTYGPEVTVKGDHFQVNGQPRFLYFVSLFDALREAAASPAQLDEDLTYIRETLGADGIRVMPNWWVYDESGDPTQPTNNRAGTDTLFNASDPANPLRAPQLAALHLLLQHASARGLIVDLTFTHETVSPAISFAAYKSAMSAAGTAVKSYRNVIIDVQNEFDQHALTESEVEELRLAINTPTVDPSRVVVASSTLGPAEDGGFAVRRGMGAVAHHDTRTASSWYLESTLTSLAAAIRSGMGTTLLPLYLQEPMAWSTKEDEDDTPAHFAEAARCAKKAGFAAWTFHQRLGFVLTSTSFKSKVSQTPLQSLRTELESVRPTIDTQVWGVQDEVYYYHPDALGSVRVVSDERGQLLRRHDFLPFGEEYNPPIPPLDRRLFTGQERDFDTAVDYFGARYYRADIGRFTTIDPAYTWEENLADPQRWNRYAYARDNPLRYTDPTGLYIVNCAADDKKCNDAAARFEDARKQNLGSDNRDVIEAALAFGDPGKANGVSVSFNLWGRDGLVVVERSRPRHPVIDVYINPAVEGIGLAQLVAHEGTHVRDDLAYVESGDQHFNLTVLESETRAFSIAARIEPYTRGGVTFGPLDTSKIRTYLLNDPYYGPRVRQRVFPW